MQAAARASASTSAGDQKNTVYVGGFGQDVDSQALYANFITFGDIMDVQIPPDPADRSGSKHRGFGFVTFSTNDDALDAIDNMHLNEINGRVLKVNMAKPTRTQQGLNSNRAIWENEEWLRQHNKPLGESAAADRQPEPEEA